MNPHRNSPTLGEVISKAIDGRLTDVHVAMPGRIEAYDASTQKASVQPLLRRSYFNESAERVVEKLPVITGVPILFPGAGGFRVTFPIVTGDTVLLVFSESSLDKWLSRGGDVDPRDDRRHSLTDAVAIPGLRDFAHTSEVDNTVVTIETETEIHAGGDESLALRAELNDLKDAYDAHIHSGVTTGAGSSGPTTTPVTTDYDGTQVLKGS